MLINKIKSIQDSVAQEIVEMLQKQLEKSRDGLMPMNTFGVLSKSIKAELSEGALSEIEIKSEDYGGYLDKGIIDVPYTSGSKTGGKSAYIRGLRRWVGKKFGLSGKKALQAAFAIAESQKRNLNMEDVDGFSASAPSNPGWVFDIKDEIDKKVNKKLHDYTFFAIQEDVMRVLNRTIP